MDHNDENYRAPELQSLLQAMKNNCPELLPITDLTANEVRRALRQIRPFRDTSEFLVDHPVVKIPPGVDLQINLFARKLTCALYFKEHGRALPLGAYYMTKWTQFKSKALPDVIQTLESALPGVRIGQRSSKLLDGQFAYRAGANADEGMFGYLAFFGHSVVVLGSTIRESNELAISAGWTEFRGRETDMTALLRGGARRTDTPRRKPS